MAARIWGPLIVIAIFSLAGGLIGADIALWPWEEPLPVRLFTALGAIVGLFGGAFIVWTVRQVEQVT